MARGNTDMPAMHCEHTREESWWEHDGNGIPLCRVCNRCRAAQLRRYRPEILRPYTQADVDERIEDDY